MILKNYMEEMVFEQLDKVLTKFDGCKCERCRLDIAAYALNHLPPKYIVSNEVFSKLSTLHQQFCIDIVSEVSNGAQLVMANPRH